jgi:hypothetical protein
MKFFISNKIKKLIKESQTSGKGYGDYWRDWSGRYPGGGGIGQGKGLLTNLDLMERMMIWDRDMEPDMVEEYGQDKGAKPSGTEIRYKRIKKYPKHKCKNKKCKPKTEVIKERITRSNPKFLGRYQKHFRRKSPQDTSFGAWPHMRDEPILPSWQPTSWESYVNERQMHL